MTSTVVVLRGGLSHERDVSLRSGRRVALALQDKGFNVVETDLNSDFVSLLGSLDSPVVVPVLHGGVGEDGALREVLELLDVAFVGSTGSASRITFDKAVATPMLARAGVAVPRQVALPHDIFRELGAAALMDQLAATIGFPMMVKSAQSGSALGASRVDSMDDLPQAMVAAYAYGQTNVIEEFVSGTEVAVTVIQDGDTLVALPPVEIRPSSGTYDYSARYTAGATAFVIPADLDAEMELRVRDLAIAAHKALGLRDVSRIDLIVGDQGPVVLEANVAPGMTETSLVPLAIEAADLSIGDVLAKLVQQATARVHN